MSGYSPWTWIRFHDGARPAPPHAGPLGEVRYDERPVQVHVRPVQHVRQLAPVQTQLGVSFDVVDDSCEAGGRSAQ